MFTQSVEPQLRAARRVRVGSVWRRQDQHPQRLRRVLRSRCGPTSTPTPAIGLRRSTCSAASATRCFPDRERRGTPGSCWGVRTCCIRAAEPVHLQYNFTLQRQLAADTVVTVSYAGQRGVHLVRFVDGNQAIPQILRMAASSSRQLGDAQPEPHRRALQGHRRPVVLQRAATLLLAALARDAVPGELRVRQQHRRWFGDGDAGRRQRPAAGSRQPQSRARAVELRRAALLCRVLVVGAAFKGWQWNTITTARRAIRFRSWWASTAPARGFRPEHRRNGPIWLPDARRIRSSAVRTAITIPPRLRCQPPATSATWAATH